MVSMERCLVGCKVIEKENDTKPNPEMVSMEQGVRYYYYYTIVQSTEISSSRTKAGGRVGKNDA